MRINETLLAPLRKKRANARETNVTKKRLLDQQGTESSM
jgi:hypothetical protein